MPLRENYTLPNKDELSDAYKAFIATMQQHMQSQSMPMQPQTQPQQPPQQGLQNLIDMLMNRGQQ
jgi:hypothetical protein